MSEFHPKHRPDRPARPIPGGHAPSAESVLRDVAYVLHLTERVKASMTHPPHPPRDPR